jgi:A/G-specific adenine glycosylase
MEPSHQAKHDFSETLWEYYAASGRSTLPWRQPEWDRSFDPYKIMVSELMLQQTQVVRVIPKYEAFLQQFPTVAALAGADQGDVLRAWQGLGYNRRAKFLWQAAQAIRALGAFPDSREGLVRLPGIGVNTAGAVLAYAYNQPVLFIETNIRSVYIHHFFPERTDVTDAEILGLLDSTLDRENPREFYWALMDYGSHLKATVGNPNKASKHYAKQSKFQGSRRQLRGQILRLVGAAPQTHEQILRTLPDERTEAVLQELMDEQLVRQTDSRYSL